MGKNGLCESNYSIFKCTIPPEQIAEITWRFACWNKFIKLNSWLQSFGVSVVKNGCSQSGRGSLKWPVPQE